MPVDPIPIFDPSLSPSYKFSCPGCACSLASLTAGGACWSVLLTISSISEQAANNSCSPFYLHNNQTNHTLKFRNITRISTKDQSCSTQTDKQYDQEKTLLTFATVAFFFSGLVMLCLSINTRPEYERLDF